MGVTRTPIEFESQGLILRGLIYRPDGPGPFPAIVLTHGYAFVLQFFEHHNYPAFFADTGFITLVYDHPNTGLSDGSPRQELDPIAQQRGYSDAITLLSARPDVDPDRIGIWGTSYSGGHVLAVGAADPRVACVVAQTPTISGRRNLHQRLTASQLKEQKRAWAEDRAGRAHAEAPRTVAAGSAAADEFVSSLPPTARETYRPFVTLRSQEWYLSYEPGGAMAALAPTPLLMIVGAHDQVTPADDATRAYERAGHPKQLLILRGGHFDVYTDLFDVCAHAAVDWFNHHLFTTPRHRPVSSTQ